MGCGAVVSGAQREYVEQVAGALKARGVRCFDPDFLWRDFMPMIRKFADTQESQAKPGPVVARPRGGHPHLGSARTRTGSDVAFIRDQVVTVKGSLAMAPMGMGGNASTTVPLPAETFSAAVDKHHDLDYAYAGPWLLAVLCWLVYFVGPSLILKLPSAD